MRGFWIFVDQNLIRNKHQECCLTDYCFRDEYFSSHAGYHPSNTLFCLLCFGSETGVLIWNVEKLYMFLLVAYTQTESTQQWGMGGGGALLTSHLTTKLFGTDRFRESWNHCLLLETHGWIYQMPMDSFNPNLI